MSKKIKSTNLLVILFGMSILLLVSSIYFTFFIANKRQMFFMSTIFMLFTLIFIIVLLWYYFRVREEKSILKSTLKNRDELLMNKVLEIEKVNSANELFLVNMSHEIRTPLNGITGFVQLLDETSLNRDQKEFVSIIKNSSDVLLGAINNILNISKVNEEILTLEETSFDIFEAIESLVEKFSEKAEQKNIILGIYIDPLLNKKWIGYPEKILLILTSLIDNAIKFTPIGGTVSVLVKGEALKGNRRSLLFSVKDNGIGIEKKMQKIIFEAFSQSDTKASREYGGFGMGLAVSSKMVESMGSKLEVQSKRGSGATFSFLLTLARENRYEVEKTVDLTSLKVGLALPDRSIHRDIDLFLEKFVHTLNAEFSIYYYDDLFGSKGYKVALPDVMIFDHRYARRKGFLNITQSLDCNKILMTTNALKEQINKYVHKFESIILSPLTFTKTIKMLKNIPRNEKVFLVEKIEAKPKSNNKNINVLIVEDNPINQRLMKVLLEKFNLNIALVSNGKEAVRMRKENSYSLIFMDIEMPVMNGIEASKKILKYEAKNGLKHVPIVALTANALIGDKEKYVRSGMDNYLSKPIELHKLKYILEIYLVKKN